MKRILTLLCLTALCSAALVGCGGGETTPAQPAAPVSSTPASPGAPGAPGAAPTDAKPGVDPAQQQVIGREQSGG